MIQSTIFYIFNCSVKGCDMIVGFHEESYNILCLNKNTTNFIHNEKSHELSKQNIRMLQSTCDDFVEYSKNTGDIATFCSTHKDLENIPRRKLYDMKTKLNLELNDVNNLIETLNKNEYFISSVIKNQNGHLCGCVIINKLLINSYYCDILTVDDTVGVCKLNFPVETIVCKDANRLMQQLAFGFLSNKKISGFELFFKTFKELSEKERSRTNHPGKLGSIFVCDRANAQMQLRKCFQHQ